MARFLRQLLNCFLSAASEPPAQAGVSDAVPQPTPASTWRTAPEPTPQELNDLNAAVTQLWALDDSRLRPEQDYRINVQSGKGFHATGDACQSRLFDKVSEDIWKRPTFLIFYHLLDNYISNTGAAEVVTAQERREVSDFLDAVMVTRPMQYCHNILIAKGLASANPTDFKQQLYQMWFELYNRDGAGDSCGFEHVFVGEQDSTSGAVSGFHNWVNFWIEERKGNLDYKGFLYGRTRAETAKVDDADRVLSVQFSWKGLDKPVTTLFIGTSPEFELALYTLCFLAGGERNIVVVDGYEVCIRCHRIRSRYGDKVGSCFRELDIRH